MMFDKKREFISEVGKLRFYHDELIFLSFDKTYIASHKIFEKIQLIDIFYISKTT